MTKLAHGPRHPARGALVFAVGAFLPGMFGASITRASIRIYDPGAAVQSVKRGVAANSLSTADFSALAAGASWYYDWSTTPINGVTTAGANTMEFVPMVWNGASSSRAALANYLAAGNRPRRILAVNEPNLRGQAFITPQATATLFQQIKAIADPYGIPVSGPQMALGSATADSITAFDPVQNATVTYTAFQPFVQAVKYYLGNTQVASLGYHTYGNIGELKWSVGEAAAQLNTKVDVTEFAWWGAPTIADARNYMIQAVDYLERTSTVNSYSWFKERDSFDKISLLTSTSGVLSLLGQTYVALPTHDAEVYYRTTGRLQAERYVTMTGAEISATTDAGADSLADMTTTAANATLDYNLSSAAAGQYLLSLRVKGSAGTIRVLNDGVQLAYLFMATGDWRTITARIDLPSGLDTLRLQFQVGGQAINWLDFAYLGLAGDYNGDGFVDAADYTVWADHFGQLGTGLPGDGNGDGTVNAADYTIWADHFGQGTRPAGLGGAVPEPTGASLLGGLALLATRRRAIR